MGDYITALRQGPRAFGLQGFWSMAGLRGALGSLGFRVLGCRGFRVQGLGWLRGFGDFGC